VHVPKTPGRKFVAMNDFAQDTYRRHLPLTFATLLAIAGLAIACDPAVAGETEANAAISRAEAKIDMVTPQAGQAGDKGDQSFNMARQRVVDARVALKSGKWDTAEQLGDEAALLAILTGEKAVLAALNTSHENLIAAAGATAATQ